MKAKLQTIALLFTLILAPLTLKAANATDLAATINGFTGGGSGSLTAIADDAYTVTVTGSLTDVTETLTLNIDPGVTVVWKADISTTGSASTLIQLEGDGTFEVTNGTISSGSDATIEADGDNSKVTVSGGTVSSGGNYAIFMNNAAKVTVSGTGKVEATNDNGTAIFTYGNVEVSDEAQVSSTTGIAIDADGDNSTVTVSGGTISATTGYTIHTTGATSTVTVSGGDVSGEGQFVIYMNNTGNTGPNVTVSGTGKVEAKDNEGTAYDFAVIYTFGDVKVDGGTISATSRRAIDAEGDGSTVTVSSGIVQTTGSGIAIFTTDRVEVNGGEVSTTTGNAINAASDNAMITVSGNGTVKATGSGEAIYTNGSVEVSDEAQVSSTTGFAIDTEGDNSTVTVSGKGKVEVTGGDYAIAIFTYGDVEVSDEAQVSATTYVAIDAEGASSKVTVSGKGIVEATDDYGEAIFTYGNVEVSDEAQVSATSGIAIDAEGDNSTVTVSGGTVGSTTGCAIFADWSSTVTVSGSGKVEATGEGATAIHDFFGGSVEVKDNAKVSATSGYAIDADWYSTVTVSGGTVSATSGYAIYTTGDNSTVTVSGGLVFAYGDDVVGDYNVIFLENNPTGFTEATGTGVVIAWNQGATTYTQGSSRDIAKSPASATAVWDTNGTDNGISYANGTNTGFIPLSVSVEEAPSVVAQETQPAGSDGEGSLALSLSIPGNAALTGSFEISFPEGITPDDDNYASALSLSPELASYFKLTYTPEANNTWAVVIEPKSPGTTPVISEYQVFMNIYYIANSTVSSGNYTVTIKNLSLMLDNDIPITEDVLEVPIHIDREINYTSVQDIHHSSLYAYFTGNTLRIESSNAEKISIYSVKGVLLYTTDKSAGMIEIPYQSIPGSVYIIRGSLSGTVKIVR